MAHLLQRSIVVSRYQTGQWTEKELSVVGKFYPNQVRLPEVLPMRGEFPFAAEKILQGMAKIAMRKSSRSVNGHR
jgi:hypothetical protein